MVNTIIKIDNFYHIQIVSASEKVANTLFLLEVKKLFCKVKLNYDRMKMLFSCVFGFLEVYILWKLYKVLP